MAQSRTNFLLFYLNFLLLFILKKSLCMNDGPKCLSNSCQKESECHAAVTATSCHCLDTSVDISAEDCIKDPCSSLPCLHNATCASVPGNLDFTCDCPMGYTGIVCETATSLCDSYFCRHGGTCQDAPSGPTCSCAEGFTGVHCETDIDECLSTPCLNGAVCRDKIGGYSCYCVPGYQGKHCDREVNECVSEPCLNGATCLNLIGKYECICPLEYTGINCELEISECLSEPCLNNEACHDILGGYYCSCPLGFLGDRCAINNDECASQPCQCMGSTHGLYQCIHCEDDINECHTHPCQNGGTCENSPGSYICHCLSGEKDGIFYGGQNCTEILFGCVQHTCQNGGLCIPHLRNRQHRFNCICSAGYTGVHCEITTTLSFQGNGYLQVNSFAASSEDYFYNINLSFLTVQPTTLIFYRGDKDTFVKLELQNGCLYLSMQVNSQLKAFLHIAYNVNDGEWHSVEVTIARTVTLKLHKSSCTESCLSQTAAIVDNRQAVIAFQNVFLGGLPIGNNDSLLNIYSMHSAPSFVGCLQDVEVDFSIIIPENLSSGTFLNVKSGCVKKDWCEYQPCQNKGHCNNLWLNYQCDCYRPYAGPNCATEYIPGRFGQEETTGYAAFSIEESHENATISMFVRTRKPFGFLFGLERNTSLFLKVWLEDGKLAMSGPQSNKFLSLPIMNDGNFYFISLKMGPDKMDLFQSSNNLGSISTPFVKIQKRDILYTGGLPNMQETILNGGYFKGCIQDLRLSNHPLEFYPVTTSLNAVSSKSSLINVVAGCIGDDLCKSAPCQNGGVCYSIWDDFTCTCPPNMAGKACEEVKWCDFSPCPPEAQCLLVYQGFECISNAIFNGRSSAIFYRSNGKIRRDLTNITFGFRTRNSDVILLYAEKEPEFFSISIQNSKLLFQLQSGNNFFTLSLASSLSVNDGKWHKVTYSMTEPLSQSSRWRIDINDEREHATSTVATGNLNFLREDTDVYLADKAFDNKNGLRGCMSTVEIGGIHLSYFDNTKKPQEEQFLKISANSVVTGCLKLDACSLNPCLNGGMCEDFYSYFRCSCAKGWTGSQCELSVDECSSNPCLHGNCSDGISAYKCVCNPGYRGTRCEEDIDDCFGHLCGNGATCVDGINDYSCLCTGNFTGRFCRHIRMPSTLCGNENRNITCYNYGNCTEFEGRLECVCLTGFAGLQCEVDINECNSNPCLNGGLCQNQNNKFYCICDVNYAGDRCEIDLTVDLSSNIFTSIGSMILVLLLIFLVVGMAYIVTANKHATQGTYSPSRQEKEGSRVEMWNMAQHPPLERLI